MQFSSLIWFPVRMKAGQVSQSPQMIKACWKRCGRHNADICTGPLPYERSSDLEDPSGSREFPIAGIAVIRLTQWAQGFHFRCHRGAFAFFHVLEWKEGGRSAGQLPGIQMDAGVRRRSRNFSVTLLRNLGRENESIPLYFLPFTEIHMNCVLVVLSS